MFVRAELFRDGIIVCEPNYLRDVKLESIAQFLSELESGQRIGAVTIGNETERIRELLHAPESHTHGKDAWANRAVGGDLVTENGAGGGLENIRFLITNGVSDLTLPWKRCFKPVYDLSHKPESYWRCANEARDR